MSGSGVTDSFFDSTHGDGIQHKGVHKWSLTMDNPVLSGYDPKFVVEGDIGESLAMQVECLDEGILACSDSCQADPSIGFVGRSS